MQGKTYIANCTQQIQEINYRLPESTKPMRYKIPMGKQILLGDLGTLEIDAIVAQLGPYGLRNVDEIKNSRKKITYLLSVGKPVSGNNIKAAWDNNRGILAKEGKERRQEAAIAANAQMNTEETPLNRMEMSVEEVSAGSEPSEDPISEGYKVDNTMSTSENKRPRRRTSRE